MDQARICRHKNANLIPLSGRNINGECGAIYCTYAHMDLDIENMRTTITEPPEYSSDGS